MDHEYYRDRVSSFHDRDMTPEELRMMQEHLDQCDECQQLLKSLEKLDLLIEKNSGLNESDYWEQSALRIEAAINSQKSEESIPASAWQGLGWKIVAVAASIAVLTFIGINHEKIMKGIDRPPEPKMESSSPIIHDAIEPKKTDSDEFTDEQSVETEVIDKTTTSPLPEQPEAEPETPLEFASDADEETPSKPVTSVDELLTQTAGIVENTSDEIFIRGGRAGEVTYAVDGVPVTEPLEKQPEKDDVETVPISSQTSPISIDMMTNTAEIRSEASPKKTSIHQFATSNGVTIGATSPAPQTDLAHWQGIRDSLLALPVPGSKIFSDKTRQFALQDTSHKKSKAHSDSTITDRLRTLLMAQTQIASLSKNEKERTAALKFVQKHARDKSSSIHKEATGALRELTGNLKK